MPLANYGVLKGKAIGAKREDDQSTPHYQVHILAGTGHNRIAVNAKSAGQPVRAAVLGGRQFPASAHGASSRLGGRLHAAATRRRRTEPGLYPRQSLQSPGHETAASHACPVRTMT